MRALVVGYGSIGARHARILTELGCQTAVVSSRSVDFPIVYSDLACGLATEQPEYVVIANSTDQHHRTLTELAYNDCSGVVLIEKPLFDCNKNIPENNFKELFVAYNLRFHPIIRRLKELLAGEKILSVQAYVGQYLPDWRPGSDYRTSYSASNMRGGGVLRDLSHELDYLTWILGGWSSVASLGGQLSSLEITSDDVYTLMMVTPLCPVVSLQLNYLDRLSRRFIIINTSDHTIEADLINGIVTLDRTSESYVTGADFTYKQMHEKVLAGETDSVCTLHDGIGIMQLIDAIEEAADKHKWVSY